MGAQKEVRRNVLHMLCMQRDERGRGKEGEEPKRCAYVLSA